jgi:Uma2 family endonuclease
MSQINGLGSWQSDAVEGSAETMAARPGPDSPALGDGASDAGAPVEPIRWTVIRGNGHAHLLRPVSLTVLRAQPRLLPGEPEPEPIRMPRWTRGDYDRLSRIGLLQPGERMEQVGGETLLRQRQGEQHALAVELAADALRGALGSGWRVRVRLPVALDSDSEPEPDCSVLAGTPRDGSALPTSLALLVEVGDATLAFDRGDKGSLYARAGITDYWIVNLKDHVLEVYREPVPSANAPFGWRYSTVRSLGPGAVIAPRAAPRARVLVAHLLP